MAVADFATTRLTDVSDVLFQMYLDNFMEQTFRTGSTTNMLIKPSTRNVDSDGINMKFEIAKGDSVRFSRSPLGDFARSRAFKPKALKVRFSETAGSNDFSEISCSATVSHLELLEKDDGAVVDTAERVYKQLAEDYDDKLALHRNLDQTARCGTVSGTPTTNVAQLYFLSTAGAASNANGIRLVVANGPIGAFQVGRRFDIFTSTGTARCTNIRVTDFNPVDFSVGFEFISTGQDISTGDVSTVASGDYIYLSGERNLGMFSFGAWFTRAASGDSFIGAQDRTSTDNRYLNCTFTRDGASSARITKGMFNDAANAMTYKIENGQVVAIRCDPNMSQALRDDIGEDAFIQFPTDNSRRERYAHFGSVGLTYQHPQYGICTILSDPLIIPNQIQITVVDDWEMLCYKGSKLIFLPGEMGGYWRILQSDTAGGGDSKYMKISAYTPGVCDFCMVPGRQCMIQNVTST